MDRKQKAAMASPKPLLLEGGNPSSSGKKAVTPPENANPSTERLEVHLKLPVVHSVGNEEMNTQANSARSSSKRKKREASAAVRRSQRILNASTPSRDKGRKHVTEEITISDTDKEDEPSESEEEDNQPEPKSNAADLQVNVEYLFQLFQEQQDTLEALKSKVINDDISDTANVSYKHLYMDSQKKVEALQEEKQQLALKLENALTKIELYERGTQVFTEAFDRLKDMMSVSNLSNVTEAAVPSTATGQEARYPSSKKKRTDK